MVKIPQKFVGLHSHSTFSVSDALGLPQEHIEYALKNGSDALALTDHGNLNGFSHQQNKLKELESKGIHFKGIPGQEFYFVDSLSHWRTLKEEKERQAILEREAKKATKQKKKKEEDEEDSIVEEIGNELSSTEKELLEIAGQAPDAEESANVVENEEESKNQRWNDPIKQRNHLVILPKNNAGLKAIFRLTSEAYQNGFYKFPRIDFDLLKKYANGNLVATSSCLAGKITSCVVESLPLTGDVRDYSPGCEHDFEKAQGLIKEYIEKFEDVFGKGNYFLEIQFNRLPIQHLVNLHILEASRRNGIKVVATADAHYANPEHWKEREIYKAMAWAKHGVDKSQVPERIEDLKCELFPKNAEQMWQSLDRKSVV